MFSHKPKFPDMDLHEFIMQLRPTSRQVFMIVVYVSRAEIPVMPVSQSFDVMLPSGTYWVIFAHDVFTFSHSAFIVLSLWTPNVDNARESNSDKFSLALSKQSDNNAVHDVRTCSNLAFWAILICANASSTKAVQTSFDIVWQFFIAGSKYIFFEKYTWNRR
jgi:hypothetical protein